MKKLVLVSFVLIGLSLSACKKNFICSCTAETPSGAPTVNNYALDEMSKRDAQFECDKKDGEPGQDCVLKNAN